MQTDKIGIKDSTACIGALSEPIVRHTTRGLFTRDACSLFRYCPAPRRGTAIQRTPGSRLFRKCIRGGYRRSNGFASSSRSWRSTCHASVIFSPSNSQRYYYSRIKREPGVKHQDRVTLLATVNIRVTRDLRQTKWNLLQSITLPNNSKFPLTLLLPSKQADRRA